MAVVYVCLLVFAFVCMKLYVFEAVDLNVFVDVAVLVALQDVHVFVVVFEGALRLCFWLILWFCLCLGMIFW